MTSRETSAFEIWKRKQLNILWEMSSKFGLFHPFPSPPPTSLSPPPPKKKKKKKLYDLWEACKVYRNAVGIKGRKGFVTILFFRFKKTFFSVSDKSFD